MAKTLAILSDLHLGALEVSALEASLVALRAAVPDLILLSGDNESHELGGDFERCEEFLRACANIARTVFIPGNHDLAIGQPQHPQESWQLWRQRMPALAVASGTTEISLSAGTDLGHSRIVAAVGPFEFDYGGHYPGYEEICQNFCANNIPGHRRIEEEDFANFSQAIAKLQQSREPYCVITHFPLVFYTREGDKLFESRYWRTLVAAGHRPQFALHGHMHDRGHDRIIDGIQHLAADVGSDPANIRWLRLQ